MGKLVTNKLVKSTPSSNNGAAPKSKLYVSGKSLEELSDMLKGASEQTDINRIMDQVLKTKVWDRGITFEKFILNKAKFYGKFPGASADEHDMASAGHMALLQSFRKWDHRLEGGASLQTYSERNIRRAFEKVIRESKHLSGISEELFQKYLKAVMLGKSSDIDPIEVIKSSDAEFNTMIAKKWIKTDKIAKGFAELRDFYNNSSNERSAKSLIHALNIEVANNLYLDRPLSDDGSGGTHGDKLDGSIEEHMDDNKMFLIMADAIRDKFGKVAGEDYNRDLLMVWVNLQNGGGRVEDLLDKYNISMHDWHKFNKNVKDKGSWRVVQESVNTIESILNESVFVMMLSII